ncbi:MAG: DUF5818 domain-containing protein [Terriglobia bacterium]
MKRYAYFAATIALGAGMALAAPRPPQNAQSFTGNISDSACGLQHMMPGDTPKQCTLECVHMGAKFVLADESHHKVYALSDQAQAQPFAGQNVVVKGTLNGARIEVKSITAAK